IRAADNPDMCLHKKYANWDNGNPIHVWSCASGPAINKTWDYDAASGRISARSSSGKCLHKKYNNWNNGNPIHLWDCGAGSNANKSWNLD
ncbi:MAG: ricin-type beta-trefoil lectin domain protein, partial [Acidobacteriota bacterium]